VSRVACLRGEGRGGSRVEGRGRGSRIEGRGSRVKARVFKGRGLGVETNVVIGVALGPACGSELTTHISELSHPQHN
jgi:hypothetical protein